MSIEAHTFRFAQARLGIGKIVGSNLGTQIARTLVSAAIDGDRSFKIPWCQFGCLTYVLILFEHWYGEIQYNTTSSIV